MWKWLKVILGTLQSIFLIQRELALENLTQRQQLVEVCGMDDKPKYLLRDRDAISGKIFSRRARALGIEEVLTAYHGRTRTQNASLSRFGVSA